jgi:hypothetical protein
MLILTSHLCLRLPNSLFGPIGFFADWWRYLATPLADSVALTIFTYEQDKLGNSSLSIMGFVLLRGVIRLLQLPRWRATTCRLPTSGYSKSSQLLSTLIDRYLFRPEPERAPWYAMIGRQVTSLVSTHFPYCLISNIIDLCLSFRMTCQVLQTLIKESTSVEQFELTESCTVEQINLFVIW